MVGRVSLQRSGWIAAVVLVLAFASGAALAAPAQSSPRQVVNLDPDWRFHLGDVQPSEQAAAPGYDDRA